MLLFKVKIWLQLCLSLALYKCSASCDPFSCSWRSNYNSDYVWEYYINIFNEITTTTTATTTVTTTTTTTTTTNNNNNK